MHELCRGCSSHTTSGNGMWMVNSECTLQPEHEGESCPCLICVVKMVCLSGHEECDKYKDFCIKQIPPEKQDGAEIPCIGCSDLTKCFDTIKEIQSKTDIEYEVKNYCVDEDDVEHEIFIDILRELEKECKKLESYFPYDIVSRDNLMALPHTRNIIMDDNEWHRRLLELFNFLR